MKKIILTALTLVLAFGTIVNAGNNKKASCCTAGAACCSATSACCVGK